MTISCSYLAAGRAASVELGRQRREVLALVLEGVTTKAISERLGISLRTVKTRIAEIFDLQQVSTRVELRARSGLPGRPGALTG